MDPSTNSSGIGQIILGVVSIAILIILITVGSYNIVFYSFKGYFDAMYYAIQLGVHVNDSKNAP